MTRPGFRWFLLFPVLLSPSFAQDPSTQDSIQPGEREVSLNVKKFASNFFSDQKMIWTFPVRLATGRGLIAALLVSGGDSRTSPADPPVARFVRRNSGSFDRFDRIFSENHTTYA